MKIQAFKIFETNDQGEIFNLFYGFGNGLRLDRDVLYEAKQRLVVDGRHGAPYVSGIHCLLSLEGIGKYLKRFSAKRIPRLVVMEVMVEDVRRKPKYRSQAYLARKMMIPLDSQPIPATILLK